jgi:hypothetical protein
MKPTRCLSRGATAGWLLRAAGCLLAVCGPAMAASLTNSTGLSVTLDQSGNYTVQSASPAWTFGGSLGATPAGVATNSNVDNLGAYSEITFNFTAGASRTAGIRLYCSTPAVLFTHTYLTAWTNDLAFPKFTTYPTGLHFVNFGGNQVGSDGLFSPYDFGKLHSDSPWLFFDTNYNSFVLSPAANFMIAADSTNGSGAISCGLNPGLTNLPANFTHRAILVIQNGINGAFDTWGNALTAFSGKVRPANDAAVELNKLGYWTDNGATYYYNMVSNSYPATLLAVANEFAAKGLPLGYMQLDSWWYPKGVSDTWQGDATNNRGGINQYLAAPPLFTNGLAAFQQLLGMPLVTHARWIDPASPYNSEYVLSTNDAGGRVSVDFSYWTNRMAYLQAGGVVTYEEDWLDQMALPALNLNDPPAFMNDMAAAASSDGLHLQYCMPLPRHILQGSLYDNLLTSRVSNDHFVAARWDTFIYDSRYVSSVGIWPWTDVYNSTEMRSLLIGTLSAGPVGVGDALGSVSAANLSAAVRADSVIVKPDVPLLPLDFNYLNDAQGAQLPLVASTYTDHDGFRQYYVFAYARTSANPDASFTAAQLGISGNMYVYDYFSQTGMVVAAGNSFNFSTTTPDINAGGSYFIVSPIGPSGLAFIGDPAKFVTAGKKRIPALADSGSLQVTVAFAAGESNVTLLGYAPWYAPQVTVSNGSAGPVAYLENRLFTVSVSPGGSGTASIVLNVVSNNLPQVTTPGISPRATVVAGTGTVVTLTETLLPPLNAPPFTYQWQSNNINVGPAITTSGASNSLAIDTTGFGAGTYTYSVVVTNASGSVTSAPVSLAVVPVINYTLNYGGAPIVQGIGADWNTVNDWNPGGQAASVTATPGSSYEVIVGSRLRTPAGTADNLFPGVELTVDGGGVFENGTLNAVGELRLKNNNSPSTNYFNELILNGGQLDLGDNTYEVIQGQLSVARNSSIYIDSTAVNDRGYQIDSWLTGPGNLFWHQYSGGLGGTNLQITCSSNTFNGQWFVDQGVLVGAGANSLGTNNIYVGISGLTAAVETLYDIQNPGGSLILGANGKMFLHQNDQFGSVIINGVSLTNGTYSFATLSRAYPTNFPASWALQQGSSINAGSGQITVSSTVVQSGPGVTNFTLNFGSGPIVQGVGADWNTLDSWNPGGQAALVSANSSNTYEVVVGSRLRTPAGTNNNFFPGVQLTIDGSGVLENGTLNAVGELRFKSNYSPATNYFNDLVLSGGQLDNGANNGNYMLAVVRGTMQVVSNSSIYVDSSAMVDRGYQMDAWLAGSGNLFWHEFSGGLGGADLQITGATNTFTGQWMVDQGALVGVGANSLGTNNIVVGTGANVAAVETLYDLDDPNGSLVLGANGQMFLHQDDHFASVIVNGVGLANGTYPFATLHGLFPTNFPSSWTLQNGSSVNFGSGQIIVGNGPPAWPLLTSVSVVGTTLALSATNGPISGQYVLLGTTNLALPLAQWTPILTNSFDGRGNLNLSTNVINPAVQQRFYILSQ